MLDSLEMALQRAGFIKEAWYKKEQGAVLTLFCRAAGDPLAQEELMRTLADLLIPRLFPAVLLARQFVMKDERLAVTWNISVFGYDTAQKVLALLQEVATGFVGRTRLPEGPRVITSKPIRNGTVNLQRILHESDALTVVEFPLPHVPAGRNVVTEASKGKGASPFSGKGMAG